MKSKDIEIACAKMYNWRQSIIVPNISWGMGLHECDLLILTKSNYATEIEIKTSAWDLKKDLNKKHGHHSELIKYLYFAVPEKLEKKARELVPERAGIILVREEGMKGIIVREAQKRENALKWSVEKRIHMLELGLMRYWNLRMKDLREVIINE